MRQSVRLGIENLESRFAPASLAMQSVPTMPVLGGLASSPLGVAKVVISYGSASIAGSSDPDGDGI
jgi:hypothetical protein